MTHPTPCGLAGVLEYPSTNTGIPLYAFNLRACNTGLDRTALLRRVLAYAYTQSL